jgi:phospholipid-binding lipoprotein MlaA
MRKVAIAAAAALCLSACSTPSQSMLDNNDPYEATNRSVFELNQTIDRLALRPNAERYNNYLPEGVRDGIHNALGNLALPVVFANDLLQAEPKRAAQTLGRFMMNSSFGIGGLFDVASRAGIEEHDEDFGQTLAVWGVGDGPYLMLPLLGPSSPRDATGQAVDLVLDPTVYVRIKQHIWWALGRKYITILDMRARNLETLDDIERDSLDFYAATRSLYRQHRAYEIRNGNPPAGDSN